MEINAYLERNPTMYQHHVSEDRKEDAMDIGRTQKTSHTVKGKEEEL